MIRVKTLLTLAFFAGFVQTVFAQTAHELFERGQVELELKNAPSAENYFNKAIEKQQGVAEFYMYRALARTRQGKNDLAISDLDTALRLKPKLGMAYYQRGNIKAFMQQHQAAIADFDSAIANLTKLDYSHYEKGGVLVAQENYDAAIESFNKALKVNPRFAEAYYARAMAKRQLQRYTEAIEDFDLAITHKDKYSRAIHFRGITKITSGDKEGGCADLRESAKLGNPVSHESMRVYCK